MLFRILVVSPQTIGSMHTEIATWNTQSTDTSLGNFPHENVYVKPRFVKLCFAMMSGRLIPTTPSINKDRAHLSWSINSRHWTYGFRSRVKRDGERVHTDPRWQLHRKTQLFAHYMCKGRWRILTIALMCGKLVFDECTVPYWRGTLTILWSDEREGSRSTRWRQRSRRPEHRRLEERVPTMVTTRANDETDGLTTQSPFCHLPLTMLTTKSTKKLWWLDLKDTQKKLIRRHQLMAQTCLRQTLSK